MKLGFAFTFKESLFKGQCFFNALVHNFSLQFLFFLIVTEIENFYKILIESFDEFLLWKRYFFILSL